MFDQTSSCKIDTHSLYARLGGTETIRSLVDRLYHWMVILPEAAKVHALHQMEMSEVRKRVTAFMLAWLGGPDTYRPQYGEPRMRRRHLFFGIGPAERDAWMMCFERALHETISEPALKEELHTVINAMAEHLQNQDDDANPLRTACNCA